MLPEHTRQYDAGWTVLRQRRGHSALFKGDSKLVVDRWPVGDGQRHLFEFVHDPGETRDLKQRWKSAPHGFGTVRRARVRIDVRR